jgi:hypothetical protein
MMKNRCQIKANSKELAVEDTSKLHRTAQGYIFDKENHNLQQYLQKYESKTQ